MNAKERRAVERARELVGRSADANRYGPGEDLAREAHRLLGEALGGGAETDRKSGTTPRIRKAG